MTENTNPFQAPKADLAVPEAPYAITMVGAGRRFLNYLIDFVIYQFIKFLLIIVLMAIIGPRVINYFTGLSGFIFGILFMITYYLTMEFYFSKTVGKMLTKTIVVNELGEKPSLGQIIQRSFSRLIPFEPFSCFGDKSRGWHDSNAKTYVVSSRRPNLPFNSDATAGV